MGTLLFVTGIGLFLGIAIGAYAKLLHSVRSVVSEWNILLNHALAKRQALLVLAKLAAKPEEQLYQEISVLSQVSSITWKAFLKQSHDLLPLFLEMEERTFQATKTILTVLNDCLEHEKALPYLETFWAKSNLCAFAATHYERSVDKYLEQRAQVLVWPFSRIFRFSSIPAVKIVI